MCKRLFFTFCLTMSASHIITATPEQKSESYASGEAKITEIIFNEKTGIGAHSTNIHYAETKNIAADLNIKEIAEYFECKTRMGNGFLLETLSRPVVPEEINGIVLQRQNIIRSLIENPEFKKEVEKLLITARNAEQEVIILLSDGWKGEACAEMQEAKKLKTLSNPFAQSVAHIKEYFTINEIPRVVSLVGNFGSLGGETQEFIKRLLEARNPEWVGFWLLSIFADGYRLYEGFSTGSAKRVKLHSLNNLINTATLIEELCKEHQIQTQFKLSMINDPITITLIKALQHPRYKEKNAWFFMWPFVHAFLYKLYEKEQQLFMLFASIAEIDAYNAIATKIIESQSQKNKFCFVNCSAPQQKKPKIDADAFWNILVKSPTANNFSEQKNVILTGPNAGGKSTSIKAIMQNMLFAQTYGFAAATKWETTPFDVIHSYINISDDIINGLSLFASEVNRAKEVIERIKVLKPEQKYFFALDELFTGTGAEAGEKIAYDFIERLAGSHGIQFFYATHFNRLKELGNKNTRCANYKVDAPIKNHIGKLKYPFTLSNGASDVNIAMAMAQEANLFA